MNMIYIWINIMIELINFLAPYKSPNPSKSTYICSKFWTIGQNFKLLKADRFIYKFQAQMTKYTFFCQSQSNLSWIQSLLCLAQLYSVCMNYFFPKHSTSWDRQSSNRTKVFSVWLNLAWLLVVVIVTSSEETVNLSTAFQ